MINLELILPSPGLYHETQNSRPTCQMCNQSRSKYYNTEHTMTSTSELSKSAPSTPVPKWSSLKITFIHDKKCVKDIINVKLTL